MKKILLIGGSGFIGKSLINYVKNNKLHSYKFINYSRSSNKNILKINKGTLKKGSDADICVIDLNKPWVVKAGNLKSKSKNTAIEDKKLQGKVLMTFLKGEPVFKI